MKELLLMSRILIAAVVRSVVAVPFIASTFGKLGVSEVTVIGEGHSAEQSEEGKNDESSGASSTTGTECLCLILRYLEKAHSIYGQEGIN